MNANRHLLAALFSMAAAMSPDAAAEPLDSLSVANAWINSPMLATKELRGKTIVLNVWTYSCINWIRSMPYVRAWAEKYKADGLVVIGVHSPEFAFERNLDYIRRAAVDMRVAYPIAVDSDHHVWHALRNQYWPALYFIDAKGRLRYQHFGEGEYERSERALQALLAEANGRAPDSSLVRVDAVGIEAAPDAWSLRSPETYVGHARAANFASRGGMAPDTARTYAIPERLRNNQWALEGDWNVQRESAVLRSAGGRIAFRFHARDLHLVMGPSKQGGSVRFRVLIDGQPPAGSHGEDVDSDGRGTVSWPRLYHLLRQQHPVEDRLFEIMFADAGVEAYVFTFG